ncbi:hypothetical protein PILCRDRAFT_810653 [Piloderma croceum F 1598]|uniref:Uncharacterized protein n=1 Tax=Piloderma croceum (strain F 1598) TaxID=765440 RepID=A0A0C3GIA7_PILCF|nr:hypothetical protein PILCRDRAFT_810653 [Piloderma croceum F 1598]
MKFIYGATPYTWSPTPFLAYYSVIFQNKTILFEAYNQNRLYRSYLLNAVLNNLWSHVLFLVPGVEDSAHWSTVSLLDADNVFTFPPFPNSLAMLDIGYREYDLI